MPPTPVACGYVSRDGRRCKLYLTPAGRPHKGNHILPRKVGLPLQSRGVEPEWHKAKRTKCSQCNGKGKYRNFRYELINPCPVCGGSGRVDAFQRQLPWK